MSKKISLLDFSAALIQKDAVEGENKGIKYYSTQKEALVGYLFSTFPCITIELIGHNSRFSTVTNFYNKYSIVRLPYISPRLFSAILFNFFSFMYLKSSNPDLVYIYTGESPVHSFGALFYAKFNRKPVFLNLRNPPSSICSFEKLSIFKKSIAKMTDNFFFKHSDKIIHISEKSKELLKSNPQIYSKCIVMGSCPTSIFFKSGKFHNIESKAKKIKFVYWGIMDKTRDLDVVIKGFAKAKEINNEFDSLFYLFGGGNDLERLKKYATDLQINGIIFKGYVKQDELFEFLNEESIAVIPIPPKDIFQYSSPLKLSEAVTLELPIIATNIEPNIAVEKYNLGILCEHDSDQYAKAFLHFFSFSSSELNEFRGNCKNIKHLFTPEYIAKEVGNAINNEFRGHVC